MVRTLNDFYRIIRIAHPIATLVVLRAGSVQDVPVEIQPAADPRENIPADIGDVLMRRHGYRYKVGGCLVKVDNFFFLSSSRWIAKKARSWDSR